MVWNARRKGFGGGQGGAAASLINMLQNLSKGAGAAGAGVPIVVAGVPRESEENGYTWNQTDEDVQTRFVVPVAPKYEKGKVWIHILEGDRCRSNFMLGDTWGGVTADESR
jgi:hypothetical protein